MKKFIISSFFVAATFAASELLPTIQSTIVSTLPCSSQSIDVVPSQFIYANVSTFAPLSTTYNVVDVSSSQVILDAASTAHSSSNARQTLYDYDTAYDDEVFEVTRTVCDTYSHCYVTTDLESSTTYTTTIDGILTVLTTVVPVSATTTGSSSTFTQSAAAKSSIQNTVAETTATSAPQDTTSEHTSSDSSVVSQPFISQPSVVGDPSTKTEEITTVITVTSCEHNKCSKVPHKTGLTVVTVTSNDMVTAYTSFCPLTGETEKPIPTEIETVSTQPMSRPVESTEVSVESSATDVPKAQIESTQVDVPKTQVESTEVESIESPVETVASQVSPPQTESIKASTTTSVDVLSTINVITNNIVTQTPESSTVSQQTTTAELPSNPQITTFEGAANSIVRSSSIIAVLISFVFMII